MIHAWSGPQYAQFPAGLATFTEKILNGKLHFLRSDASQILEECDSS